MLIRKSKGEPVTVCLPVQYFVEVLKTRLLRNSTYGKNVPVLLEVLNDLFFCHSNKGWFQW